MNVALVVLSDLLNEMSVSVLVSVSGAYLVDFFKVFSKLLGFDCFWVGCIWISVISSWELVDVGDAAW